SVICAISGCPLLTSTSPATISLYTLSLHDALPISSERGAFSIFTRVGLRQGVLAVLQQRQFRQRLFHISPPRRARIAFQKFLVGFLCLRGLRKMRSEERRVGKEWRIRSWRKE